MFGQLAERMQGIFRKLAGTSHLTESNMEDGLKEIRLALLEADVHYQVVKDLMAAVREKALGQEVLKSLSPGEMLIKVVRDELNAILGEGDSSLAMRKGGPTVVMMVGLQGSGKTTSCAKLVKLLEKDNKRALLAPADVYRPAATEQLMILAKQADVPVYDPAGEKDPVRICESAVKEARQKGRDVVILDTAGRLHIDDELMQELERIKKVCAPDEILFVADAMTGQSAVDSAKEFHARLALTGVVLTKMDGDARGGAALSIKHVVGAPVKFVGVGEKLDALEPFHPDRMTSRVLGMGDVLSLIEKAEAAVEADEAARMEEMVRKGEFTLEDMRSQLKMLKRMGPLEGIMSMIPGLGDVSKAMGAMKQGKDQMKKVQAILDSMTLEERAKHYMINANRRKRIAKGSGTHVSDVDRVIKQFFQMQKMMKMMKGGKGAKMMQQMQGRGKGR